MRNTMTDRFDVPAVGRFADRIEDTRKGCVVGTQIASENGNLTRVPAANGQTRSRTSYFLGNSGDNTIVTRVAGEQREFQAR